MTVAKCWTHDVGLDNRGYCLRCRYDGDKMTWVEFLNTLIVLLVVLVVAVRY